MANTDVPHYREFLKREFESRTRRNPGYSLRAFARDIGMTHSKLSEVLRGHRGISPRMAEKIVQNLHLSDPEKSLFLNLVNFHQKRNSTVRNLAEEKLKEMASGGEYDELSLERFRIIADWYHFAILELTELSSFQSNTHWIAARLRIAEELVIGAVERLLEFGLLKRLPSGDLVQTHSNLATPSGIPSRELREHHSQILMKADDSLRSVDMHERDVSAITLAFDSSQMDEVRRELKKLRRRLGKRIQDRPKKDRVYCLAVHFFPLDQENDFLNQRQK